MIVEFPSIAHVDAWLGSAEYRSVARLRVEGADTPATVVEGPPP